MTQVRPRRRRGMEEIPTGESATSRARSLEPRRRWVYGGLGLPRSWADVSRLQLVVLLAIGLTVWGYVDVSRRGRIVGGHIDYHKTDFTVFTEAGAAFFDGRDPYQVTSPRGWFYLYPPLLAL